jgi:hypothetical protein
MGKGNKPEELLTEVAAAASRATGQHGTRGAFIDAELDLWQALHARLCGSFNSGSAESPAPDGRLP